MLRITTIFIINILMLNSLHANEPTLATLESVTSNEVQKFRINQFTFYCKPYGVVSVEELYKNITLNATCKKSIEKFYIQNPQAKYFTHSLLKPKQMYHLEFKDQECILFAKGEKTLSELLLENGYGVLKPMFEDKEYKGYFTKSQNKAKLLKKGLWGTNIIRECIAELYK